jgi:hypothetical protein
MKKGHANDHSDYEATGRTFVCWNTNTQAQMQPSKLSDEGLSLVSYSKLTLGK